MKATPIVLAICLTSLAASTTLFAKDLTWSGGNWNYADASWKDGSGNASTFANGDNVLFDDTQVPGTTVNLTATVAPGSLVFNIANSLKVSSSGNNFFGASSIVKNGEGTLTWSFNNSNNGFTTPVVINRGVLICDTANQYGGYAPVKDNATRNYVINDGGELRVTARNCFGKCDAYALSAGGNVVRLKKGGKFSLYLPDKSSHVGNSVWDLYLEGGTLDFQAKGANDTLGLLLINHKLRVSGDTPYVIANVAGYDYQHIAINKTTPTIFDISDVTGDGDPDLTLDISLTQDISGTPQLVKQGAGTMLMLKKNNIFKSNMVIKEGTVSLDYHNPAVAEFGTCSTTVLGDLTRSGRTITIQDTGKLEIKQRNIFVAYGADVNAGNTIVSEFIVANGGSIVLRAPSNFGPLTFNGGSLELDETVNYQWGAFSVRGALKVCGSAPTVLKAKGSQCRQILYRDYATVFDVADVTGDAAGDFISDIPVVLPNYADYYTDSTTGQKFPYGFVKRGVGTMVTTADSKNVGAIGMNGEARVTEGTLQVDGNLGNSSAVVVSAGAYLAGTGTVNNVQIAVGGGFRCKAGQTESLKLLGNLAIGANPVIRIDNPDLVSEENVNVKLLRVVGNITGAENLADATVYLGDDVWEPGRYEVSCSGGILTVKRLKGLMIIVR